LAGRQREFSVVIELDEDGCFMGEAPQMRACYSQVKSVDELMANMHEVIELCLEDEEQGVIPEFIGAQRIMV
jgi:predicted RNase H-like HicB family nuclease